MDDNNSRLNTTEKKKIANLKTQQQKIYKIKQRENRQKQFSVTVKKKEGKKLLIHIEKKKKVFQHDQQKQQGEVAQQRAGGRVQAAQTGMKKPVNEHAVDVFNYRKYFHEEFQSV